MMVSVCVADNVLFTIMDLYSNVFPLFDFFLYPLGNVRLYEVSGQQNTEAALLQLKKPDDRLAHVHLVRCYPSSIFTDAR